MNLPWRIFGSRIRQQIASTELLCGHLEYAKNCRLQNVKKGDHRDADVLQQWRDSKQHRDWVYFTSCYAMFSDTTYRELESQSHEEVEVHHVPRVFRQLWNTTNSTIRYNLPVDTAKTFPVIDQLTRHTGDSKLRIRTEVHSPPT